MINITILVVTTFILAASIIFLVNSMQQLPFSRKPIYAMYMKILLNHLQLLQVVAKIEFGWPEEIQKILNIQALITALPE